ncbi:MAG: CBS domain-containing protein [Deltaproteobacteria bacterium]|nr:CBS domain-containing protein [Deltaproteobacteria bacterium]
MEFEQALQTEKIRNIMTARGIQVDAKLSYAEVITQLQTEEKFCAVILEDKKVVGIFTELDALRRGLLDSIDRDAPIRDVMTPNPTTIDIDDNLAVAIRLMHQGKYRHLPVVDGNREFMGLISVRDIIIFLSENYPSDIYNLPPDPHQVSTEAEGA